MIVKFIFGIHLSSPELMLVVFLFLVAGQKQSPFAGWIKGGKGKRPRKSPQEVLE